jgi:cytochrome c-type biogenesis protein CcmH/NrfG
MSTSTNRSPSRTPIVVMSLSFLMVLALVGWSTWHWWNSPEVELSRALTWLEQGRCDQAAQILERLGDRTAGLAPTLTRAAVACLRAGSSSSARRLLERSLKIQAGQGEAEKLLAAIYLSGGDESRAVQLLEQAAEHDPRDFRPWYALGKVLHDQGKYGESAEAYRQALLRSPPPPESRESQIGRARALLDAARGDDADSLLAELRAAAPGDPRVLVLAARRAGDQGDAKEALELADQAAGLDRSFDALFVRARLRILGGLFANAAEDLEDAVALKPNDVGALQLLLQVQDAQGLKSKAATTRVRVQEARRRQLLISTINQEIQQHPDDPEPRFRMGRAAAESGMITLAEQSFHAALDLNPSFQPAREALAELARTRSAPQPAAGSSPALSEADRP